MSSYFILPFNPGTRKLSLKTLNSQSAFRAPQRKYMPIYIKELEYVNELLTVRVRIHKEEPEYVYLKVTETALLVSCSVDTDESYLSRSAYFGLLTMIGPHETFDFEYHYWPGFFDAVTGVCKFMVITKMQGRVVFYLKARYHGFYKPGHDLPVLSADLSVPRKHVPAILESKAKSDAPVLGFCLADMRPKAWGSNHWPFLIPYVGVLDKNKTAVKGFESYVFNDQNLFLTDLDDEQYQLNEICFEMKKIALMEHISIHQASHLWIVKDQIYGNHFKQMFELWEQAMPILAGRLYTHYYFTYAMRNVKGKPRKQELKPCTFRPEIPELCFLWKEFEGYYKLELRFKLGKKIWLPSIDYPTTFFANTAEDPKTFYLLNSVTDCQLMNFFHKTEYRLLIMKAHYEGRCKEFVDHLRDRYRFI
ncbi:MAG: hypothetical protein ABWY16_01495 [Pedobacter sp.]|uniref:hypothetical protein n=1 Tax=Pedobacter sp. TaxID=1411316 RepID=UPI003398EEC9